MAPACSEHRQSVQHSVRPPYLAGAVARSPQLRRDISNALAAGVSPRRYAGWEPVTRYHYDDEGRITHTTVDPEWDAWDNALVDELLNWQAGVHSCGHHESEQADPDTLFVAGYTVCKACEALQRAQEAQAKTDEPDRKAGKNPDYPRRWVVRRRSRTEVQREAAERAARKSPQQLMNETLARLNEGKS